MASAKRLIISCEHGGNRVPAQYVRLFEGSRRVLESHRGYDPGSLELGKAFARRFRAPLIVSNVTRLLVEVNRSIGHRSLFSEFSKGLDAEERQLVLQQHYFAHRDRVEGEIAEGFGAGDTVIHLSMHTFTPELRGSVRGADVGLLYDPQRKIEQRLCEKWRRAIVDRRPDLRVRRNYPYLGKADGFTTYLRRQFAAAKYAGIELEVNQLWPKKTAGEWRRLIADIAESFSGILRDG